MFVGEFIGQTQMFIYTSVVFVNDCIIYCSLAIFLFCEDFVCRQPYAVSAISG